MVTIILVCLVAVACWQAWAYRDLAKWQETRTEYWYQECVKVQDALFKELDRKKKRKSA